MNLTAAKTKWFRQLEKLYRSPAYRNGDKCVRTNLFTLVSTKYRW